MTSLLATGTLLGLAQAGSPAAGARSPALRGQAPVAPPNSGENRGPAVVVDIRQRLGAAGAGTPNTGAQPLSDAERQQLEELKARDAEVRRHEQAHARAGGPYAGQPSYDYQRGPDGRSYAVGGEVPIDVAPVPGNAAATIEKMEVVKRAALAPADPSAQDRAVASTADARLRAARAELSAERRASTGAALDSPPTPMGNQINIIA